MKLLIIGPKDTSDKIETILKNDFKNIIYKKSLTEEAEKNFEEIILKYDGIIFTGISIYFHFKDKYHIPIPYVYIEHSIDTLAKALFLLKNNYPNMEKMSIDVLKNEEIKKLLIEYNMENIEFINFEYNPKISQDSYFNFHNNYQKINKNSIAITALAGIYLRLINAGQKVIRIYPTGSSIKNKIEELITEINFEYIKESLIGVQIINIDHKNSISSYKILELNSYFENKLVEYLKVIEGSFFSLGQNQFIIFSTQGAIKNIENSKILINLLEKLEKKGIKISIGNGFSKTVYESEISAKRALEEAMKEKRNCIFEASKNKIKGPLHNELELEYTYSFKPTEIEKIKEITNINPIYIAKILWLIRIKKKIFFSSTDLATYLNISLRTSNRIIKTMLESNLAEIQFLENKNIVGRPKQIIRFLL